MFPAVGLVAEWTLELFHHPAAPARSDPNCCAVTPIDVSLAHQLLEMLLEAGLVSKLATTVGAAERPVRPIVGRLEVVVEEALFREVLIAVVADEGALPRVYPVVDVQVGLAGVRLLADGARERFLA